MKDLNLKSKIGNRKPFLVPENYFEEFAAQWDAEGIKKTPTIKLQRKKFWYVAAAVFFGFLVAGQVLYSSYKQSLENLNENYELYLYSQLDRGTIYDYYEISED